MIASSKSLGVSALKFTAFKEKTGCLQSSVHPPATTTRQRSNCALKIGKDERTFNVHQRAQLDLAGIVMHSVFASSAKHKLQ